MANLDSQLENLQQEVELYGRCGAETISLNNIVFKVSGRAFDIPSGADMDAATVDFEWFLEAATNGRVTAHPNPGKSFWIQKFGNNITPYGLKWRFQSVKKHLEDAFAHRRAVLYNSGGSDDPPCILCYQFQWVGTGTLDCTVFMRSSDIVGFLPQDIVMTRMLLRHVGDLVNAKPGDITFHIGNAHVFYADAVNGEEHEFDVGL